MLPNNRLSAKGAVIDRFAEAAIVGAPRRLAKGGIPIGSVRVIDDRAAGLHYRSRKYLTIAGNLSDGDQQIPGFGIGPYADGGRIELVQ